MLITLRPNDKDTLISDEGTIVVLRGYAPGGEPTIFAADRRTAADLSHHLTAEDAKPIVCSVEDWQVLG